MCVCVCVCVRSRVPKSASETVNVWVMSCLFTDVDAAVKKEHWPPTNRSARLPFCLSLSLSLSFTHMHATAAFLSTNHIDPIRSHQLAPRRATACDSPGPRQPTYVRGRKAEASAATLSLCWQHPSLCRAERPPPPSSNEM